LPQRVGDVAFAHQDARRIDEHAVDLWLQAQGQLLEARVRVVEALDELEVEHAREVGEVAVDGLEGFGVEADHDASAAGADGGRAAPPQEMAHLAERQELLGVAIGEDLEDVPGSAVAHGLFDNERAFLEEVDRVAHFAFVEDFLSVEVAHPADLVRIGLAQLRQPRVPWRRYFVQFWHPQIRIT
jgi:hypothetical protein